ncbi:hypothetical protein P7C73_g733, partial [Tremellales sp. Uapishka_1]
MSTSLSPSEISYIITGLSHSSHPTRQDGRGLLDTRPISISYGEAPQANGSARVVLGGTQVVAGVRLEVGDVEPDLGNKGWRGKIEVDVTLPPLDTVHQYPLGPFPSFSPGIADPPADKVSPGYRTLLFLHSLNPRNHRYFIPHLHLTLLSSSGSVPFVLALAARAAFSDLRIPKIKRIGWEDVASRTAEGELDAAGIKGAVRVGKAKGKGKSRGEEWDLDMDDGEGLESLQGREKLPILVTLNLVPGSEAVVMDASAQEEVACPDRLHCFFFFNGSGKLCGLRMEGGEGLDVGRIRPLLEQAKSIASTLIIEVNAQIPQQ